MSAPAATRSRSSRAPRTLLLTSRATATSIGCRARALDGDRLRHAVVGDPEVRRRQAGDRPAAIEDQRFDADHVDAGAELRRRGGADGERDGERQLEQRADHGSPRSSPAARRCPSADATLGRRCIPSRDRIAPARPARVRDARRPVPTVPPVCSRQRPQSSDADGGRLRAGPVLLRHAVGGDGLGDAALSLVDVGEEEGRQVRLPGIRLESGDAPEMRLRRRVTWPSRRSRRASRRCASSSAGWSTSSAS